MNVEPYQDTVIKTSKLCKTYGHNHAVVDLDLSVKRGELFGFLGPNGAGKTTTIRMLTGLVKPSSGTALVAGHNVAVDPLRVKAAIGYLAETPFLYDKLSGREFLRFVGDLYRLPLFQQQREMERLIDLFDLRGAADQLIETYSHGTRQKVALCGVLLHDPAVIFLDEPTNGLDPRSARIVKDVLKGLVARGTTVFVSSHILEIIEHMCDRVAIIDKGHLVAQGTIEELRGVASVPGRSLEDIFLELTGGPEFQQIADYLRGDT